MKDIRKKRIERLIRDKISGMLVLGELKDPRLNEMITVTDVRISGDFREAKVFVSVMGDNRAKTPIITTLNHAAGFIQKCLSERVRLRYTPRLVFHIDDSLARGFQINKILKGLES